MRAGYLALLVLWAAVRLDAAQPNFIFILSDDQNWNGLSVQMDPNVATSKSSYIETPHIEKLAREGARFSQAYAPASVCSPTRISLQTGKSPAQLHWTKAGPSYSASDGLKTIPPRSIRDIPQSEVTIAEVLKTAGYGTAHYGKWHIGGGGPEAHGYDESDGNTGNEDAAQFRPPNPGDVFGMSERAGMFMERMAKEGKPFYVQLSCYPLHFSENALPETIAKYQKKISGGRERRVMRAAIAENLDAGVGKLLQEVERLGLAKNTYVIYMSDNGGAGGGGKRAGPRARRMASTQPLRGGKGSLFEGGIRVPLIVRGPGIKAGSVCSTPVVGYDLLPTLCKLAGVKQALPKTVEGGDFSHLLHGRSAAVKRPREELIFHFPHYQGEPPHSAIRLGDHKLIHYYEDGRSELFNLKEDLKEQNDISKQYAKRTAELRERLLRYLKDVNAQRPSPNPHHVPGKEPEIRGPKRPPGGARKGRSAPP